MPKTTVMIPGSRKSIRVKTKFKLGSRKNGTAGLGLTTEVLLDKYENPQMNKDKQTISQILDRRGLDVKVLLTERKAVQAAEEAARKAEEAAEAEKVEETEEAEAA